MTDLTSHELLQGAFQRSPSPLTNSPFMFTSDEGLTEESPSVGRLTHEEGDVHGTTMGKCHPRHFIEGWRNQYWFKSEHFNSRVLHCTTPGGLGTPTHSYRGSSWGGDKLAAVAAVAENKILLRLQGSQKAYWHSSAMAAAGILRNRSRRGSTGVRGRIADETRACWYCSAESGTRLVAGRSYGGGCRGGVRRIYWSAFGSGRLPLAVEGWCSPEASRSRWSLARRWPRVSSSGAGAGAAPPVSAELTENVVGKSGLAASSSASSPVRLAFRLRAHRARPLLALSAPPVYPAGRQGESDSHLVAVTVYCHGHAGDLVNGFGVIAVARSPPAPVAP
ncbi:hypothetical protein KC361_g49 [Hortaea werneckii]|nr:hypothetical protein KC361_g49 [Hortaea werneckii]